MEAKTRRCQVILFATEFGGGLMRNGFFIAISKWPKPTWNSLSILRRPARVPTGIGEDLGLKQSQIFKKISCRGLF